MSIAYFAEMPNLDPAAGRSIADTIRARVGANQAPAGGRFHAEGPTDDGGWWSFSLWDSEDDWQRFQNDHLIHVLRDAGQEFPPARRLEVSWDTTQLPQQTRS